MTAFANQFRRAGASRLTRQFGETVTYYAGGEGDGRAIQAIITRNPQEIIQETGDVTSQAVIVRVRNSDCDGISSKEVNTASDEVGLNLRAGDHTMASRRSIVRILSDHGGMMRLLCQ